MSENTKLKLALEKIVGREATTEEVKRFYEVKEILGVGEHDAIWSMLLAFGHYEILYRDIPVEIERVTKVMIERHNYALEQQARMATEDVQARMVDKVGDTANKMAQKAIEAAQGSVASKTRAWMLSGVIAGIVLCCGVGAGGFYLGKSIGQATKLEQDAFLQSANGSAALALAKNNDLVAMERCDGYSVHKTPNGTFCIPIRKENGQVINYGWKLK